MVVCENPSPRIRHLKEIIYAKRDSDEVLPNGQRSTASLIAHAQQVPPTETAGNRLKVELVELEIRGLEVTARNLQKAFLDPNNALLISQFIVLLNGFLDKYSPKIEGSLAGVMLGLAIALGSNTVASHIIENPYSDTNTAIAAAMMVILAAIGASARALVTPAHKKQLH